MEFFCHECEVYVLLTVSAVDPMAWRSPCTLCRTNFLDGSKGCDGPLDFDESDDIQTMDAAEARFYITQLIQDRLYAVAAPEYIAVAPSHGQLEVLIGGEDAYFVDHDGWFGIAN